MILVNLQFSIKSNIQCEPQGPLTLLKGFDISMVKFCSMHVCNLGLVHTASGGALCLGLFQFFRFPLPFLSLYRIEVCTPHVLYNKYIYDPREALLREGHFGPFDGGASAMKSCLETAFNEFQQWRRSHKIACSQRSFAPRHLLKAVHGYYLTTKAYNARIVMLWLAEKCQQVALNSCANSPIHLHATALQLCCWFWKLFFFSSKSYALIHIPNTTKVSNTLQSRSPAS